MGWLHYMITIRLWPVWRLMKPHSDFDGKNELGIGEGRRESMKLDDLTHMLCAGLAQVDREDRAHPELPAIAVMVYGAHLLSGIRRKWITPNDIFVLSSQRGRSKQMFSSSSETSSQLISSSFLTSASSPSIYRRLLGYRPVLRFVHNKLNRNKCIHC